MKQRTGKGQFRMEHQSNYEKWCEEWRQKFLTMDQEDICRRLPEIDKTEQKLLLWHYGRQFAVDRKDGTMTVVSDDRSVDLMPQLNIYTLFWYAKEEAVQLGNRVPFRELKGASPFGAAFQKGILEPLAATFSGNVDRLEQAVMQLGGERLSQGKYLLHAFSCIPVAVNFWDADEEFPAQANMLFDSSATEFNHVESIVSIAVEGLFQLSEAVGIQLKGSPFARF